CANARGLKELKLIEGAEISNMVELTQWIIDSDKVLTF
ncbi:MAG: DsrE family protein, partial [Candidatus Humimicrobiaceae bacterium]